MAGHSKWANIKFRKAAQDAKRGKVFTKLIKEITVSARLAGADVESNPRLRSAIDKALSANMTRDTIDRAVKRGAGATDGTDFIEISYEGYAPGGVAVLVECSTDNKNRTVGEVRHAFTKHGGNLGTDGSVAYLFSKLGEIIFSNGEDEESVLEIALEAGADDVESDNGIVAVTTSTESFGSVSSALQAAGFEPSISEIAQRPNNEVEVADDEAEKVRKLIDALEDIDDVENVFTNASFAEAE